MARLKAAEYDERLTLVEHLDELRTRLVVCLIVLTLTCAFCFWQNHALISIVNAPLPNNIKPITLSPAEPFLTTFKLSMYAGIIIALPILLYQAYAFVLPALSPAEKRVIIPFLLLVPVLMALLEVVAGVESAPRALAVARAAGEAMGKEVIEAVDGPGFLVNRCNRPFGLEALKLLQERVADVEAIDAIVRAAGFRMGPFELQDLVGIDIGYEVSLDAGRQRLLLARHRNNFEPIKDVPCDTCREILEIRVYDSPAA